MSKVIRQSYEYVSLSDVIQSTPYPNGYSPSLPTPPGVSPVSQGITVTDQYQSDTASSAAYGYGTFNFTGTLSVTVIPTTGLYTCNLPTSVPPNTNVLLFNVATTGASLVGFPLALSLLSSAPAVRNGAITNMPFLAGTGRISSVPAALNPAGGISLQLAAWATVSGIETSSITTTFQLVWWG